MPSGDVKCPNCHHPLDDSQLVGFGVIACPYCESRFVPETGSAQNSAAPTPIPLAESVPTLAAEERGNEQTKPIEPESPGDVRPKSTSGKSVARGNRNKTSRRKRTRVTQRQPTPPPQVDRSKIRRWGGFLGGLAGILLILGVWWSNSTSKSLSTEGLPSEADWFEGNYYVFDDIQAFAKEIPRYPSFQPFPEANATVSRDRSERWNAFPIQESESIERSSPLAQLPIAANANEYVLLIRNRMTLGPVFTSQPGQITIAGWWQRFSWATNEPVGFPHAMGTRLEQKNDQHDPELPSLKYLAALSSDGNWFAAADYGGSGKIQIWSREASAPSPLDPAASIESTSWIAWNSQGQLLLLSDERLLAYSPTSQNVIWERACEADCIVEMAPESDWLVLSSQHGFDLIDANLGTQLAQLPYESEHRLGDVVISPDGQRIAALYMPSPSDFETANRSNESVEACLMIWELKTGEAFKRVTTMHQLPGEYASDSNVRVPRLDWAGQSKLILYGEYPSAEETGRSDSGSVVSLYDTSQQGLRAEDSSLAAIFEHIDWKQIEHDPCRRPWIRSHNRGSELTTYHPVTFLSSALEEHQEFLAAYSEDSEVEFEPLPKLRLEIDAGSESAANLRAQELQQFLSEQGISFAPNHFCLRVRLGVADSGKTLKGGHWEGTRIPKVMVSYQLLDPQGVEVWRSIEEEFWLYEASRYSLNSPSRAKANRNQLQNGSEKWDFSGDDPWSLMSDEICKNQADLGSLKRVADLIRSGGEYQVPAELKPTLIDLEKLVDRLGTEEFRSAMNSSRESEFRRALNQAVLSQELTPEHRDALNQLAKNLRQPINVRGALTALKCVSLPPQVEKAQILALAHPTAEDYRLLPAEVPRCDFPHLGVEARLNLPEGSPAPTCFQFSQDGSLLYVFVDGWVYEFNLTSWRWTKSRKLFRDFYKPQLVAFSQTFDWALSLSGTTAYIVSSDESSPIRELEGELYGARLRPCFTNDDTQVFGLSSHRELSRWDISTGKLIETQTVQDDREPEYSLSQDGSILAASALRTDFYDAQSLDLLNSISGGLTGQILGNRVFLGTDISNSLANFWKLESQGKGRFSAKGPFTYTRVGKRPTVREIVAGRDGSQAYEFAFIEGEGAKPGVIQLSIWEIETGTTSRILRFESPLTKTELDLRIRLASTSMTNWIALSPTEDRLAVSDGRTIHLINLSDPKSSLLALNPSEPPFPDDLAPQLARSHSSGTSSEKPGYTRQAGFAGEFQLPVEVEKQKEQVPIARELHFETQGEGLWVDTGENLYKFDRRSRQLLRKFIPQLMTSRDKARARIFNPVREQLVVVDYRNNILLIDAESADRPVKIELPREELAVPKLLGLSFDGSRIYLQTRAESSKAEVIVWDLERMRVANTFEIDHNYNANFTAIVERGESIVQNYGQKTRIIDSRKMTVTHEFNTEIATCFDVSENMKFMVLGQSRQAALFTHKGGIDRLDPNPDPKILDLKGDELLSVALSSDGAYLATLQYDAIRKAGLIQLTDTKTMEFLAAIPKIPTGDPLRERDCQMSFSPDDQNLLVPLTGKVLDFNLSRILNQR